MHVRDITTGWPTIVIARAQVQGLAGLCEVRHPQLFLHSFSKIDSHLIVNLIYIELKSRISVLVHYFCISIKVTFSADDERVENGGQERI